MRRKLRHGRQKALFGSEAAIAAATLAAAGITSAASLAAAKIGKDATISGAKRQAEQVKEQSKIQSESLAKQNENNTKLNEQIIQTNKDIADRQAEAQRTMQMNMALLAGQENMNNRLEMSKMQLAAGGKLSSHSKQSLLRGGNNIRFKLPRRGNVELVGVTPEGYNLYSIYGPSHKSGGVDIDFENGGKIEAEGDAAKTGRNKKGFKLGGEYMLTTPNDAFFISQHDIDGFNPAEAVDNGMHPLQAYKIQEINKRRKGINDDGSKRAMTGTSLIAGAINPTMNGFDSIMNNDGIISQIMAKRQLKNGGRVKALWGVSWDDIAREQQVYGSLRPEDNYKNSYGLPWRQEPYTTNSTTANNTTNNNKNTNINKSGKFNWSMGADLIGSGISALSGLGAAFIGASAQRKAASIMADAAREAYQRRVDAANNLKGIDAEFLKNAQVEAVSYIPALRTARYNANPQIASVERKLNRNITNISRNSLSAASMNNQISKAQTNANDALMTIYADQANRENAIKNENADRITEAARYNAEGQNRANVQNAETNLYAAKYNADVNNKKWDIIGDAGADASSTIGNFYGSAATNNAQLWGNALTSAGASFNSGLTNMAKRKNDLEMVMLGADPDNINTYYANSSNVTDRQAKARVAALQEEYNNVKDTDPARAAIIKRRIREINAARGFN